MSNTGGASSSSKVTAGGGSSASVPAISPEQFAEVKTTLLNGAYARYGERYRQVLEKRLDTYPGGSLAIIRGVIAECGYDAVNSLTDGNDTQTEAAPPSADLAQSSSNADNLADAMQGYSQDIIDHPLQMLGDDVDSLESARGWFGYCDCASCSAVEASLTSQSQGDTSHIAH